MNGFKITMCVFYCAIAIMGCRRADIPAPERLKVTDACNTSLLGMTDSFNSPDKRLNYAIVDRWSGLSSGAYFIDTGMRDVYDIQAVADGDIYCILIQDGASASKLIYTTRGSETSTIIKLPGVNLSLLDMDKKTKNFYAIKRGDGLDSLVTFTIAGSSIKGLHAVAGIPGTGASAQTMSVTVNQNLGEVYVLTSEGSQKIYKYVAGNVSAVPFNQLLPGINKLMAMRYNETDNNLYVLFANDSNVIEKIDPITGSMNICAGINRHVDVELLSATIDACKNQYIVAGFDLKNQENCLMVYDITAGNLSDTATGSAYYGLAVMK